MYGSRRGFALAGALALGALFLTTPAASAAPAPQYRIVELGALSAGTWTQALAINERGHVVGQSNDQAVLWRDGRTIGLGVLPGDLLQHRHRGE